MLRYQNSSIMNFISYVLIIDTRLTEPHRNCIYEGGASNYHLEIINKKIFYVTLKMLLITLQYP